MMEKLNNLWCSMMHDAPMWPMHGRYECRTCGREIPVEWAGTNLEQPAAARPVATFTLARASK